MKTIDKCFYLRMGNHLIYFREILLDALSFWISLNKISHPCNFTKTNVVFINSINPLLLKNLIFLVKI